MSQNTGPLCRCFMGQTRTHYYYSHSHSARIGPFTTNYPVPAGAVNHFHPSQQVKKLLILCSILYRSLNARLKLSTIGRVK